MAKQINRHIPYWFYKDSDVFDVVSQTEIEDGIVIKNGYRYFGMDFLWDAHVYVKTQYYEYQLVRYWLVRVKYWVFSKLKHAGFLDCPEGAIMCLKQFRWDFWNSRPYKFRKKLKQIRRENGTKREEGEGGQVREKGIKYYWRVVVRGQRRIL